MVTTQKVVLATSNKGKLAELADLLAPAHFKVVPQSDFAIPDAIEDGLSFIENALIKARHASRLSGLPAMADDSGLAVDALGGAPGIHSARYAGVHGNDQANLTKLLTDMAKVPAGQRQAQFHCVLVYVRHADDPVPLIAHGIWSGQIGTEARGNHGFGYDPVFLPAGSDRSAAELTPAEKKQLSHRAKALQLLLSQLKGEA